MNARRRIGVRRVVIVAAATALVLLSTTSARAQESTTSVPIPPPQPVGLSLVKQDTWVPLEGTFSMTLHIDNPELAAKPNAAILIQIHPSATSRSRGASARIGSLTRSSYGPACCSMTARPSPRRT